MKRFWLAISASVAALVLSQPSDAAPKLRLQVEQKGDFVLIGNTLAQECAPGAPPPIVGTVGACGAAIDDTAPDVFWRADEPAPGQALADTSIASTDARSTAILELPPGASVTHAYLYWSAITMLGDSSVTLDRPGEFSESVPAIDQFMSVNAYQSVADVTSIVAEHGSGAYRVSDVKSLELLDADSNARFAGFWMVVLYKLPSDPPRTIAIFDGLDFVSDVAPADVLLEGLSVPPAFGQAKLGVVAYEGDGSLQGDQLFFNGVGLSNALNPANNFFNSSHTFFGAPVSTLGDLPQLSGLPESVSGIDIDVVDVTSTLVAGQTSAPIQATSTGDTYHLAGFVTSIPALRPDFSSSQKTANDLDGEPTLAEDTIEYTLSILNDGSDASIETVMTDPLPDNTTYVPGTIEITSGFGAGKMTDAAGDDACEYDGAQHSITCRLGVGADAQNGGTLAVGESVTIVFQVTVNEGFSGFLSNQAEISAAGAQGAPTASTPTDGDDRQSGSQPTETVVDGCATDAECTPEVPYCNTDLLPNECVLCLLDAHCPGLLPVCDPETSTCVCVPSGDEVCDFIDNDCDGQIDEEMGVGEACSAGVGACFAEGAIVCDESGNAVCDAVPGAPSEETCADGIDSDCDGNPDNGCEDKVTDSGGCACDLSRTSRNVPFEGWLFIAGIALAMLRRRSA